MKTRSDTNIRSLWLDKVKLTSIDLAAFKNKIKQLANIHLMRDYAAGFLDKEAQDNIIKFHLRNFNSNDDLRKLENIKELTLKEKKILAIACLIELIIEAKKWEDIIEVTNNEHIYKVLNTQQYTGFFSDTFNPSITNSANLMIELRDDIEKTLESMIVDELASAIKIEIKSSLRKIDDENPTEVEASSDEPEKPRHLALSQ